MILLTQVTHSEAFNVHDISRVMNKDGKQVVDRGTLPDGTSVKRSGSVDETGLVITWTNWERE